MQFLSDRAELGIARKSGICKDHIEPTLLPLDLREEAIEITKVRYVSLYLSYISSNFLYRPSQLVLTASGGENVRDFIAKVLRGGKADTATATSHHGNFSVDLTHTFLLMSRSSRSVSG